MDHFNVPERLSRDLDIVSKKVGNESCSSRWGPSNDTPTPGGGGNFEILNRNPYFFADSDSPGNST